MSLVDDIGPDAGGDDIVAAEYVLGVLPTQERATAARRIDADRGFATMVDRWEVHFAPLAAGYAAVEAPASVKAAVDRRLFVDGSRRAAPDGGTPGLLSSLALWRGIAVAALAALALYVALPLLAPRPAIQPPATLVASLAADGSDVRYLAVIEGPGDGIGLSHVSGLPPEGRAFELWVIAGDQPPVSLGVIPTGPAVRMVVGTDIREKIAAGAVFAISLEPPGGSPTGQPTGAVVAAGDLRKI
ncbi:anti-sigma factor [Mesorhizobium marinum]|uniref:anti-sigma factor n=1 Tax=Mesorhizobium marinum TaxID=3228790 RepID=UPI0034677ECF